MHISGAIYTIPDKVVVTHINNLRPFNYDEERTDPVTVAKQNAQEFIIEESNSWKPYKTLMRAESLHR